MDNSQVTDPANAGANTQLFYIPAGRTPGSRKGDLLLESHGVMEVRRIKGEVMISFGRLHMLPEAEADTV